VDVCTLGMFIIATSKLPEKPGNGRVLTDIMGGAGSYTALGARIFAGSRRSRLVGWIVDCGSDFPDSMRREIEQWDTSCLFRPTPERLTTRGWNGYGAGEQRAFRYTTPKLRLDETNLTTELLMSKSFHLICQSTRCMSLVNGIMQRRDRLREERSFKDESVRPMFIWEPVPDLCIPSEWDNCRKALNMIDCISPNHVELAGFFGKEAEVDRNGYVQREVVETLASQMINVGIGPLREGSIVVRAGKDGCCIVRRLENGQIQNTWLPAYHSSDTGAVIDPTGGGNTFLGGLAMALINGHTPEMAAAYGSVVAGVAIEQIGMPKLEADRWNGI
ncbi:Ribokinase-like protein, partial [Rhizodiscina lignyota]